MKTLKQKQTRTLSPKAFACATKTVRRYGSSPLPWSSSCPPQASTLREGRERPSGGLVVRPTFSPRTDAALGVVRRMRLEIAGFLFPPPSRILGVARHAHPAPSELLLTLAGNALLDGLGASPSRTTSTPAASAAAIVDRRNTAAVAWKIGFSSRLLPIFWCCAHKAGLPPVWPIVAGLLQLWNSGVCFFCGGTLLYVSPHRARARAHASIRAV